MKEVSESEEGLSEIGMSEKCESRFWEVDELGCACWRKNAEIELDADLVLEKDNVCIGLHLKLYQWVTGWEGKVIVLFDESLDSQFRIPPTEEVELKLDNSFRYNNQKIWELVSEAVFKSVRVADVYGSSLFFLHNRVGLFITECSVNLLSILETFSFSSYIFSKWIHIRWIWDKNGSRCVSWSDSRSYRYRW